jgi:hypothetical protein
MSARAKQLSPYLAQNKHKLAKLKELKTVVSDCW